MLIVASKLSNNMKYSCVSKTTYRNSPTVANDELQLGHGCCEVIQSSAQKLMELDYNDSKGWLDEVVV